MQLDDGSIAKLTFEKGTDGSRTVGSALATWDSLPTEDAKAAAPAAFLPSHPEILVTRSKSMSKVPARINGMLWLDFLIDSGATYVSVPGEIVSKLKTAGALTDGDFAGTEVFTLADGSKVTERIFRIRRLQVGDQIVENVKASTAKPGAPLLLGQSFLTRFRSWSIDNNRGVLALDRSSSSTKISKDTH